MLKIKCLFCVGLWGVCSLLQAHMILGTWYITGGLNSLAGQFYSTISFRSGSTLNALIELNYLNKKAFVNAKGSWQHSQSMLHIYYSQASVTGNFTDAEKTSLKKMIHLKKRQTFFIVEVLSNYLILQDSLRRQSLSGVRKDYVSEQEETMFVSGSTWQTLQSFQFDPALRVSLAGSQTYDSNGVLGSSVDVMIDRNDVSVNYRLNAKGVWHQEGRLLYQQYTHYNSEDTIESVDQSLIEKIWKNAMQGMIYNIYFVDGSLFLQNRQNLNLIKLNPVR